MDGAVSFSIHYGIYRAISSPIENVVSGSCGYVNSIYADNGIPMGAILDSNGEAITDLPNGEAIEEN